MIGPIPSPDATVEGKFNPWWYSWFKYAFRVLYAAEESGTTANRPTTDLWVGRRYYDTTLSLPVYVSSLEPTVWKDAVGNTV